MILASLSSLLGSVWFATTLGLVGFIGGWYFCKRACNKCRK